MYTKRTKYNEIIRFLQLFCGFSLYSMRIFLILCHKSKMTIWQATNISTV